MDRVLVTGASGFLGRLLTQKLIDQGKKVTVFARRSSRLDYFNPKDIHVVHGDITDRLQLLQATEEIDTVYHLAGLIAYKSSERQKMEKINVGGTGAVVDACITNKVPRLLYLSSVVTIGASSTPDPVDEDFSYNLSKYNLGYFETKREAEKLVINAVNNDGLNAFMINPSTIYGEGDATKGSRKTQVKVAKGRFKLFPPGGVNVVYVQDVLEAIDLCLLKGIPGRRYIISGDNLTIQELFAMIADAAGVPHPHIAIPLGFLKSLGWFGDQLRKFGYETSLSSETAVTSSLYHWFSNERAKRELGFKPTPAKKAINESVQWMKSQGLLGDS
ncbi:MAG: NAD-dependent epimerase/dehydratase family protein [Pseudomonadota bacterium]